MADPANRRVETVTETQPTVPGPSDESGVSHRHFVALDGLRGIAILFVMAYHYVATTSFGADCRATRALSAIAGSLWTGVDVFFVLSGFLITGILLHAKEAPGYFKNFYMRRALRIFPLYFASLFLIFVVLPHCIAFDTPGVRRIYDSQGWLWAYSENLAITFGNEDYFNVDWLWVGHFWSLSVEEHFYLVWPLLVFVCSRRALLATALGLMVLTPLLRAVLLARGDYAGAYTFTLCRADELACGGIVAILLREVHRERLAGMAGWALGASAIYVLAVFAFLRKPLSWAHWTMLGPGFSAFAVGTAALLVFAVSPQRNALQRVLENRILTTFGKYSYGAYIFHTPLQPLYLRFFPPERIGSLAAGFGHTGSRVVGLLAFAALSIAITMALAFVSFWTFERHFLRLKRFFEISAATGGHAHGVRPALEPSTPRAAK